ncbi:MAG TPA: TetR/AcrR family transcriptional regulator [Acidimicrobiia bacterium]|jgi:AcrR family transcriptional regulator
MPAEPLTRKARTTRDALVGATREVVRRTGSLTPDLIAYSADVSTATFYTYFDTKDDALALAFDQVAGELGQAMGDLLTVDVLLDTGLESQVRAVLEATVVVFRRDGRLWRLAVARLPEAPAVGEAFRRRQEEAFAQAARFVRLGQRAGKVRDGEPDALARVLMMSLYGLGQPMLEAYSAMPLDLLVGMIVGLLEPQSSTVNTTDREGDR